MGIEPTLSAWEAEVLPLNYTRMVPEGTRLEESAVSRAPIRPAEDSTSNTVDRVSHATSTLAPAKPAPVGWSIGSRWKTIPKNGPRLTRPDRQRPRPVGSRRTLSLI